MTLIPLDQHDPRLRQVCAPLTRGQLRDREQQLEIEALLDFVNVTASEEIVGGRRGRAHPHTMGLAGNQVGIMKQICVVDLAIGQRNHTNFYVLINPRLVWQSKSLIEKPEGCINFKTTWGVTRRSRSVRVQALDRSGNELELKLTGWSAALVQHEIDHLGGHLFIDRLGDPTKAHFVPLDQYSKYRHTKPSEWGQWVDVSDEVVREVN